MVGAAMAEIQARLRDVALSLPGAREDFPWGERVAKVNKKVFVFFGHDDETEPSLITVKLVESHGHALTIEGTAPSGYGSGAPAGSTSRCRRRVSPPSCSASGSKRATASSRRSASSPGSTGRLLPRAGRRRRTGSVP
jgi:hypothetical protein